MKTSDQIIIEELKRIILMQAQEITRLMTRVEVPERELARYTTRKVKLEMTDTPDEIIEHRACFCPECGKDVSNQPFEFFGKRQLRSAITIMSKNNKINN